jgi:hypothetical protein
VGAGGESEKARARERERARESERERERAHERKRDGPWGWTDPATGSALSSPKLHSDVRGGAGGGGDMGVSCDEAIVLKRQAQCLNPGP